VCFSTGLSAETTLFLSLLRADDHLVVSEACYGGTVRLLQDLLSGLGVRASFVDTGDVDAVAQAVTDRTRLVFVETPANPTLRLTDIAAVAEVTHAAGALLAVDNTFLTPVLQRPLELGADISVYSTTKHIEGHNSTVGGAITTRNEELRERLRLVRKTIGTIQSPFEAWLTLRGIKTLPLRLRQHSANALAVAEWLESRQEVSRVLYPGLSSFPQHDLATRQQLDHGGILSFELAGGTPAGIALMNSVKLCALAENLGAVETLITHPASMTHASVPREQRERIGLSDGLVRLSVGLEDPSDIIADIQQALTVAAQAVSAGEEVACQAN
jgi:cystathionine beta-lyase/cystathionine gamma-synthase